MLLPITTRFHRGQLPHWEVHRGRYFVTVRCHDSLPQSVVARLREIQKTLAMIEPRSTEFTQLRRQYFATTEKYLDQGIGRAPLIEPECASILTAAFDALAGNGVTVPHYTIMPNHWHALFAPAHAESIDLRRVMTALKGRTARAINLVIGATGPLWQREWFDHWIRDEQEWNRCVTYIRQNPVKAGLATDWRLHRWTR